MPPDYYGNHLSDYLKSDTPFESIETIGKDAEDIECDILLTHFTYIYVSPLSNIDLNMTVTATAVKVAGVNMSAYVIGESSVEAAAARLGRVIYNAFAPDTQLYNQVATQKASAAKDFEAVAAHYRSLSIKPILPEEARKYMVQAEAAVKRQSFSEAADRYRDALKIAPWWPEGYFNRALLLGETGRYKGAIANMKKYLRLIPAASDAQAAQDKIYEWEGLAAKENGQ
ncbi:MAG: tetratricopeptide repeat protein [Sideroxydans sp.]